MNDVFKMKAIGPVAIVALVAVLLVCGMIGCSGNEEKPVSSEDESISAVQDRLVPSPAQQGSVTASSASSGSDAELGSESESTTESESSAAEGQSSSAQGSSHEVAGFTALSQYPELPNGCEITSLAAVLNYYEFGVDKTTLSDVYLPKAPVGQADFYQEFVGNPRDDDAYGCYSPVIVATANSYLPSVGSSMSARDLTGSSPEGLYALIDEGRPVIVWATRYMEPGHYSVTWNVGGQSLTWYTPEHCLVLVGYDEDNGAVQLADPMVGDIVDYDMDVFEQRYAELKNQAVVIE